MNAQTLTIRETTTHGDYRNVRTITLPSNATGEDFHAQRLAAPYSASSAAKSAQVWDELLSEGTAAIGWVDYEIVSRGDVGGYYFDGSLLCRYCTVNVPRVEALLSPKRLESFITDDGDIDSEAALTLAASRCGEDWATTSATSDRLPVRAYVEDIAGLECRHCGETFAAPTVAEDDENDTEESDTNHATWAASLWLNNDEGLYGMACEAARNARSQDVHDVAGALKDLGASLFDEDEHHRVYGVEMSEALKRAAAEVGDLTEVDWETISESFMDDEDHEGHEGHEDTTPTTGRAHVLISEDDGVSCLTCGAHYCDDSDVSANCSGDTSAVHCAYGDYSAHSLDDCEDFEESGYEACAHVVASLACDCSVCTA